MKLICMNVIKDFNDAFNKGSEYNATEFKDGMCLVTGERPHKHHDTFQALKCLDYVIIHGIATFKVTK